jgi:2-oxoglutarate ferredoxin oxidoreductase subunit delta
MSQAAIAMPTAATAPRRKVTRGTVVIATERCKGCELCIPACPPGVLSMSKIGNHLGYLYPELAPGCTGCTACQQVCPDFVFEVWRYQEPIVEEFAEDTAP